MIPEFLREFLGFLVVVLSFVLVVVALSLIP